MFCNKKKKYFLNSWALYRYCINTRTLPESCSTIRSV